MTEIAEHIKDFDNVELFNYLHETPGHYSDYSSLYIYLAKHPPMHDYYFELFWKTRFWRTEPLTFLDLGPGVGYSLDVARELGHKTYFVDRDIFISKYCENKGHNLISMDYFELPLKDIGHFDYVLSRGSLNVDMMNETNFHIDLFLNWLVNLGKHIVVLPTWNKGPMIDGNDYTCVGQHLEDYLESKVHKAFMNFGFEQKSIEGVNDRLRFPITYEYFSIK